MQVFFFPFSRLLMFSKLSPLSIFYLFFFLHLFFFTFFSLTPFTPPFKVFLKFYCYPHSLVSTYTALIFLFLMLPFVLVPSLPYSQFSLFTCLVPYDGICQLIQTYGRQRGERERETDSGGVERETHKGRKETGTDTGRWETD